MLFNKSSKIYKKDTRKLWRNSSKNKLEPTPQLPTPEISGTMITGRTNKWGIRNKDQRPPMPRRRKKPAIKRMGRSLWHRLSARTTTNRTRSHKARSPRATTEKRRKSGIANAVSQGTARTRTGRTSTGNSGDTSEAGRRKIGGRGVGIGWKRNQRTARRETARREADRGGMTEAGKIGIELMWLWFIAFYWFFILAYFSFYLLTLSLLFWLFIIGKGDPFPDAQLMDLGWIWLREKCTQNFRWTMISFY
jgi:hypothetical protein